MSLDMQETQIVEKFIVAVEKIADALAGIDETQRQEFAKRFPEPKEPRDAVVTRIPTEEDRIREEHGSSDGTVEDWLNLTEEIGPRERDYLAHRAGAEAAQGSEPVGAGVETPESKA
jgi:hypothetical protein